MLERLSAQQLAEWQAFLAMQDQMAQLVAEKVDPKVAYSMVWERED